MYKKGKVKLAFRLWIAGALLGFLCAFVYTMPDLVEETLRLQLSERMHLQVSFFSWLRCLWITIRYMLLFGLAVYLPGSVIWIQMLVAGCGFLFGFSVRILGSVYGVSGFAGALVNYIPRYVCMIPVIYTAFLCTDTMTVRREYRRLWFRIIVMAMLSSMIEMKTASWLIYWCLKG